MHKKQLQMKTLLIYHCATFIVAIDEFTYYQFVF